MVVRCVSEKEEGAAARHVLGAPRGGEQQEEHASPGVLLLLVRGGAGQNARSCSCEGGASRVTSM